MKRNRGFTLLELMIVVVVMAILAAVDALPAEFREVLVLSDMAGLGYAEIAAALAVPVFYAGALSLALTWIAVIAGLSAKTADGAGAFSYPIIFLPFISSAFVPTDTMPGPVRAFAENQPVTSIVDSMRMSPDGNWVAYVTPGPAADTRTRLFRAIAGVSGARVVVDSSKGPWYGLALTRLPDLDVRDFRRSLGDRPFKAIGFDLGFDL